MGVLNITLDSFSDGGKFLSPENALVHARQLLNEGADIIDVGGESTRPGALPVTLEEELERVVPVIEKLSRETDCIISIDTSKAEVARCALEAGAEIVNDVTGLRGDPHMLEVAKASGAGVVIMHMQGTPRDMQANPSYQDVVAEVGDFFRQMYQRAVGYGIDPMCIAFDPGIGFGKTVEHNLLLLKKIEFLRVDHRPMVIGVSRKSFIGKVLDIPDMEDRFWPTVALSSLQREAGANVFRVHDVKANREAVRMTEAILGKI